MENDILIIVENTTLPKDNRVYNEAITLIKAGFNVHIICPKGKNDYTDKFEIIDGINIYRHPIYPEGKWKFNFILEFISALFWEFIYAVKIYRKTKFSVIQACNPPDLIFIIALYFKIFHKVKFVFDHHDLSPELYYVKFGRKDSLYKLLLIFEKLSYKLSDFAIVTNNSFKEIAINRCKKKSDNIVVVRNGPIFNDIYPMKPNPNLKYKRKYLISYIGLIGSQDGLKYLIQAANELLKTSDVMFYIIGDGPDLPNIKSLATKLKIQNSIKFTGYIENAKSIQEILTTSDVCVCPDEVNELNNKLTMIKIMEYMVLKKPIVAFELKETVFSAGKAALYAKKNDYKDFAKKIKYLLDNPKKRIEMGDFGYSKVKNELAWEYQESKYIQIFNTICNN